MQDQNFYGPLWGKEGGDKKSCPRPNQGSSPGTDCSAQAFNIASEVASLGNSTGSMFVATTPEGLSPWPADQ